MADERKSMRFGAQHSKLSILIAWDFVQEGMKRFTVPQSPI